MALPNFWDSFLAAIRAQESGGNYSEDTAGCLGAYCWNAQSNWDGMAKAAGQTKYVGVNPSQVPPAVQDDVASSNLYRIYQQTHSLSAAAMWWNGGSTKSVANPGLPTQPWAKTCGGGSTAAYACQVLQRMSLGGHYLAGSGAQSGSGGVVTTAAAGQADCAISLPSYHIGVFFGHGPSVGGGCLLSKSEARALLAVANLVAGGVILVNGLVLMVLTAGPLRRVITLVTSLPGGKALSGGAQATGAQASSAARVTHESGYGTIPAGDAARAARADAAKAARAAPQPKAAQNGQAASAEQVSA